MTATATDAAGNTSSCSGPLSYTEVTPSPPSPPVTPDAPDTVAPETILGSAPSALINRRTATFEFSSEPGARFECRLDAAPFAPCPSASPLAGIRDGRHTFAVRAIDAAGNADPTPATKQFTVDATPPDTRITSKPKASITARSGKGKAAFAFTATEKGSKFQCKLDRGAFASCRSPLAVTLKPGRHTFQVRAIDTAGNADTTPATAAVTVKR
jgi:hypothetical protein